MCGILGYLSNKRISVESLSNMNDMMIHRGPDDSGVEVFDLHSRAFLGMAHRRLSILDLSEMGHQPMHSLDDNIVVVFNGEIYNYLELKDDLGYSFKTDCDTEVIIAAYLKWGIDFVNHFNGMFTIALFDRLNDRLILARDYIGKKPLYYYIKNRDLIWSSELKPIISCPITDCRVKTDILGRFITNKYINAPETILEDVYKLEPGCLLCFNNISSELSANVNLVKYWDVNEKYHLLSEQKITDYESAKAELEDLLIEATKIRMRSDVPVGIIFSGGYDSSLVTALAQKISSKPVKTFTIGFEEKEYDESIYAKKIADYLGTEHTELVISDDDLYEQLNNIEYFYDEPFADSSQIPTMLVAKLAKKDITVALGGDGGDEFFCGYPMYETAKKLQAIDPIGKAVHSLCNLPLIRRVNIESKLPLYIQTVTKARNNKTKTQFRTVFGERAKMMLIPEQMECLHPIEDRYNISDLMIRRMLVDMDTFLPGDILCKSDRASMRYSLELRSPILDRNVVEYSYRLDHNMKYYGGNKKRILKDISYRYIPKEMLDRPKQGFNVPLSKWLCYGLNEELHDYLNEDFLSRQGFFDYKNINSFVKTFENAYSCKEHTAGYKEIISGELIWGFFLFQRWYSNIFTKYKP